MKMEADCCHLALDWWHDVGDCHLLLPMVGLEGSMGRTGLHSSHGSGCRRVGAMVFPIQVVIAQAMPWFEALPLVVRLSVYL